MVVCSGGGAGLAEITKHSSVPYVLTCSGYQLIQCGCLRCMSALYMRGGLGVTARVQCEDLHCMRTFNHAGAVLISPAKFHI